MASPVSVYSPNTLDTHISSVSALTFQRENVLIWLNWRAELKWPTQNGVMWFFSLQTSRESLKVELLADVYLLPGEERIIGRCECSFIPEQENTTVVYIVRLTLVMESVAMFSLRADILLKCSAMWIGCTMESVYLIECLKKMNNMFLHVFFFR